jgi:hypothetical protein
MLESVNGGRWLDLAAGSRIGAGPVQRQENQDNYVLIDGAGRASFLRSGQGASVASRGLAAGPRCAWL